MGTNNPTINSNMCKPGIFSLCAWHFFLLYASCRFLFSSPPFAHLSSKHHRTFPVDTAHGIPVLLLSLLICHQEAAQTPFMLRKSRGKNFHLDCRQKKRGRWVNGPHHFSLRGSDSASSGRGKIPEPWPMLERVKPYGEHSERGFYPQAKIRPDWGSNWRPCGERHYRVRDSQLATLPFSILIASIRTNPTYH